MEIPRKVSEMPLNEAPSWIREFLEIKAPWWLEEGADPLDVVFIDQNRRIARVRKSRFTYTLLPELNRIA